MKLNKEASMEEVFAHIERNALTTILFVDQSLFCNQYTALNWVPEEADIVEVDQEILESFQIGKVPQFRFYFQGSEVGHQIGTLTREQVQDFKKEIFKDVRSINK